MITGLNTEPSQVKYPWKAVVRTAIQSFFAAAVILALVAPELQGFVEQFWPGSPAVAWIASASAFVAALSAVLARIMAIPQVNILLTKIGLGASPQQ